MSPELWVVLICTALTLFFSVAHTTLRNASRVRLEEAFSRHHDWLTSLDRNLEVLLLSTGLVRNLCHLGLAVAMLYLLGGERHWANGVEAVMLAGAIVAVFGIGVPYAWAKYAGERTVAATWPVLVATRYLFWPVIVVLGWIDVLVRRLSGAPEPKPEHKTNILEQEILQLASEGQAEGVVDPTEMQMIESVIEFGDLRAGEVMTPRTDIVALEVTSTLAQCRQLVVQAGPSRIPVFEESLDRVVGVLYAKDLLAVDPDNFSLRRIMRKPFFVPEAKTLKDLLQEFKGRKVHMAIVLDEYGGTAGLVTIEDLLEEIVGEIADEYEPAEPAMLRRIDPRTVEIDARMYIDDLNDALNIKLPEDEDYDTVGGFVFSTLGYIPKADEQLEYASIRFIIVEAEARKINRIRVQLPGPGE